MPKLNIFRIKPDFSPPVRCALRRVDVHPDKANASINIGSFVVNANEKSHIGLRQKQTTNRICYSGSQVLYEKSDVLFANSADESLRTTLTTEVRMCVNLGDGSHRVGVSAESDDRRCPLQVRSPSGPDVVNPNFSIGDQDLCLLDSLVGSQGEWWLRKKVWIRKWM